MTRSLSIVLALLVFLLLACRIVAPGGDFPPTTPTPSGPTPTPVILGFERSTPQVKATDTPVPPPPTPTSRPSPTPTPTQSPATAPTTEEAVTAETPTIEPETAPVIPSTEMVEIPAGPFTMGYNSGLDDEQPEHVVDLPAFNIDIFEVTNSQFAAFADETGYQSDAEQAGSQKNWRTEFVEGKENYPVVRVSWNDAQAYCQWVGKRLPTEEEWEKAARGPENTLFPWGNEFDPAIVNGKASGLRGPVTVGTYGKSVSAYGLFDMAGNVWEWTDSWYQPYPGSAAESPYYGEQFRILRGGGWFDVEKELRATRRSGNVPTAANDDIGFRCAQ